MPRETNSPPLPSAWIMVIGSALILFHLFCALITTLFMSSGPWPIPGGGSAEWLAPEFAITAGTTIAEPYQRVFKNTHAFRFPSIKQEGLEITMEVVLRDATGTVTSKHSFPAPEAPASVRYRQLVLAQQLGNDMPLPPQTGVIIAPAGEKLPTVRWWHQEADRRMVLKEADPNTVPRNQSFMTPSPFQYIVAKSFARFLGRQHPGQKVEIIRAWHEPILPMVLLDRDPPTSDILRQFQSSYGELPQ